MKTIANLLTSGILTFWVVAIAILSVQNATPVSFRFLTFQSIQLPVGIVLAFTTGIGILTGAIVPLFWGSGKQRKTVQYDDDDF